MALKRSIVVVNEYTKRNSSGIGSRGSTPGNFVMSYMSRDTATETLTPVKLHSADNYYDRYAAREDVVNDVYDRNDIEFNFRQIQKYGGVAFGYGRISLSDEELMNASNDIQDNYNKGKTVMKTVVSFDEDYLRENGLIPSDFQCNKKNDYKGNLDQMKLRLSIMYGLEKMSHDYNDLQYVGVIQVDTLHVHCHLAMVDRGENIENGKQNGKFTMKQMRRLRDNIDHYLDDNKHINYMSSNIARDKANTAMFVKRVSYQTMARNGMPQLLYACLPEDTRKWRATSTSDDMKRANALTRRYVRDIFSQSDSGYDKVQRDIESYAKSRRYKKDLSRNDYNKLVKASEKKVEDACMNSIYDSLKNFDYYNKRDTHTPMLDAVSKPLYSISKKPSKFDEFTYRFRSYASRLDSHKKKREDAHEITESYRKALDEKRVSNDAKPVYDFFKFEEEYNEKLMCKYQHFLHFIPSYKKYKKDIDDITAYEKNTYSTEAMYNDEKIKNMSFYDAEQYGQQVYSQTGGQYMTFDPGIIYSRMQRMHTNLEQYHADLDYRLAGDGLEQFRDSSDPDKIQLRPHVKYDFDDVKMLDLHHMSYDSGENLQISDKNRNIYIATARKRAELASAAREYLIKTGQESECDRIDSVDIDKMNQFADSLMKTHEIKSKRDDKTVDKTEEPHVKTSKLSDRFDIAETVRNNLNAIHMQGVFDDEDMEDDSSILGRRMSRGYRL